MYTTTIFFYNAMVVYHTLPHIVCENIDSSMYLSVGVVRGVVAGHAAPRVVSQDDGPRPARVYLQQAAAARSVRGLELGQLVLNPVDGVKYI